MIFFHSASCLFSFPDYSPTCLPLFICSSSYSSLHQLFIIFILPSFFCLNTPAFYQLLFCFLPFSHLYLCMFLHILFATLFRVCTVFFFFFLVSSSFPSLHPSSSSFHYLKFFELHYHKLFELEGSTWTFLANVFSFIEASPNFPSSPKVGVFQDADAHAIIGIFAQVWKLPLLDWCLLENRR